MLSYSGTIFAEKTGNSTLSGFDKVHAVLMEIMDMVKAANIINIINTKIIFLAHVFYVACNLYQKSSLKHPQS